MFTFLKSSQMLLEDVVASGTLPVASPTNFDKELTASYEAVAARLGVAITPSKSATPFRDWLAKGGIPSYDHNKVQRYLDRELGHNRGAGQWGWRRARTNDRIPHRRFCAAPFLEQQYRKPIPLPVLLTMERIVTKFPAAQFFISDALTRSEQEAIRMALRDPFLLAIVGDEWHIVERWDEPRFRP